MDAAAIGVTEKEDREGRIDEQDIFHRVIFFLAAITPRLFNSVLGADDASLGAVMGKRGALLLDSRVLCDQHFNERTQ